MILFYLDFLYICLVNTCLITVLVLLQFREIIKGQPSDFQMLYKTITTEKLFITTGKLYMRETVFEQ